jgi:superfamily II DNA or RNA helicase
MWTLLKKDNLKQLLNQYPFLYNFEDQEYLLHETDTHYILPRYFGQQFPSPLLVNHKDGEFEPKSIDIEPEITIRPGQKVAIKYLLDFYKQNNELYGLFQASPGFGKTAAAAFLTATLKKKTLIILDNTKLMEQWTSAYTDFTTLEENDIGILQGKKFETDKPVGIAMVQTLLSKVKNDLKEWYVKVREAGYDLVFYDECHKTSSAGKFATSSLLINTPNIVGLTATPYAQGINEILLKGTIGEPLYVVKDYDMMPKINFIKYDSGLGGKYQRKMYYMGDYIKKVAFHNSIILQSEKYLDNIHRVAEKCMEVGHRLIIIVSTKKQVETICSMLVNKGLPAKPFYSAQREVDQEADVLLVATSKYASAGFDYKALSALLLACPLKGKTSVIQTSGRILRTFEGKKQPVIFDLIDTSFGDLFLSSIKVKTNIFKSEFKTNQIVEIDV